MARRRSSAIDVAVSAKQPALPIMVVRAVSAFSDVLTRRKYNAGDVVPWDAERATRYAERGLVVIEWHTQA